MKRDSTVIGVFGLDLFAAAAVLAITTRYTTPALLAHAVIGSISVPVIHCLRHLVNLRCPYLETAFSFRTPAYTMRLLQRGELNNGVDIARPLRTVSGAYGCSWSHPLEVVVLSFRREDRGVPEPVANVVQDVSVLVV